MATTQYINTDTTITSSNYWATDNDAYIVSGNVTVTINSNVYIAAGGGSGGASYNGGVGSDGRDALYLTGDSVFTIYNRGYLFGGGGGGGFGISDPNGTYTYYTGGNGGAGGGGGGGAGGGAGSSGNGGNGGGYNSFGTTGSYNGGGGGGGNYNFNGSYGGDGAKGGTGSYSGGGGGGGGGENGVSGGNAGAGGGNGGGGSYSGGGGGGGGAGGGAGGSGGGGTFDFYWPGGGGGGSGGGLGGGSPNSDNFSFYGGKGGYGINTDSNVSKIILTNAQGIFGALYFNGFTVPKQYYIYITNINSYGKLVVGPNSGNSAISEFYISSDCYGNVASLFNNGSTTVTLYDVIRYHDDLIPGTRETFYIYDNNEYCYYLDTNIDNYMINLVINLLENPTIINFFVPNKTLGDLPFTINPPNSTSDGAFMYTSSNLSVATISGNVINIIGAGTSDIKAIQAATNKFSSEYVTFPFVVSENTPTNPVVVDNGEGLLYFMNTPSIYANITNTIEIDNDLISHSTYKVLFINEDVKIIKTNN
jgi:hypothetical protein